MEGINSVGEILDLNFLLSSLQFLFTKLMFKSRNKIFDLSRFLVETCKFDFLVEQSNCFFSLACGNIVVTNVVF